EFPVEDATGRPCGAAFSPHPPDAPEQKCEERYESGWFQRAIKNQTRNGGEQCARDAVLQKRNGKGATRSRIAAGERQLAPVPEKRLKPKHGAEEYQHCDD